jgi:predicted nucleotide-binding protein
MPDNQPHDGSPSIEYLENEIKVSAPHKLEEEIQAKFNGDDLSDRDGQKILDEIKDALSLGDFSFREKRKIFIEDRYFDDNQLSLYRSSICFRVRRVGDSVEATVKTPQGGMGAELVRRERTRSYADEGSYEEAERSGFGAELREFGITAGALKPVLQVSNNRLSCLLFRKSERYQLSIDVFTHRDLSTERSAGPTVEIEIEAKTPEARQALPRLREHLQRLLGTRVPESKYAQGVRNLALEAARRPADDAAVVPATGGPTVFVVHGHDIAARLEVVQMLAQLGLQSLVLKDLENEGLTIIEKFEKHSNVQYAIVLMTPDDVAYGEQAVHAGRPRARQNVIFEFGYFVAKLGRENVCVLAKGDVEVLSDYGGVQNVVMDSPGAWRLSLGREMKRAGLPVDLNRIS